MGKAKIFLVLIGILFLTIFSFEAQAQELDLDTFDGQGESNSGGSQGWIVSDFIDFLTGHTYNFVRSTYGELAAKAHNYYVFFVGVWFIYVIVTVTYFRVQANPFNLVGQLLLIIIVSSLLTTGGGGAFFSYFYDPLMTASSDLANFFMGKATGGGGDTFSGAMVKLENMFKNSSKIAIFIVEEAPSPWRSVGGFIKAIFMALCLIVVTTGLVFLFAAYWSYAIFALHILFAITPIALCLYPFKATRSWTMKWFSGILNYLFIPVLLSISMGITISIFASQVEGYLSSEMPDIVAGGNELGADTSYSILFLMLTSALSFLVHLRIGDIAAHLTGGISTGLSNTWSAAISAGANSVTAGAATTALGRQAVPVLGADMKAGIASVKSKLGKN